MRIIKNYLLLVMFMSFLVTSCKKEGSGNDNQTTFITNENGWFVESVDLDEDEFIASYLSTVPEEVLGLFEILLAQSLESQFEDFDLEPCQADDIHYFNSDGTYLLEKAGIECSPALSDDFSESSWSLNGDGSVMTLKGFIIAVTYYITPTTTVIDDVDYRYNILTLNDEKMELELKLNFKELFEENDVFSQVPGFEGTQDGLDVDITYTIVFKANN